MVAESQQRLDVSALGVVIRLEFAPDLPDDFVARVRSAWSDAVVSGVDSDVVIPVDVTEDIERRLERLSVEVTLATLAYRKGEFVLFHAAAIADPEGRVAAFVGPSGRGKTTLSRQLAQHYGYVSDETTAVDSGLNVFPYRKPLSIVREGMPKDQVAPGSLGLKPLPDTDLRLTSLTLISREEGISEPKLEPVDLVEAFNELVPQLSYLPELPTPLQTLASLIDRVGGVNRLTYAEAVSVPEMIPDLLAGSATRGYTSAWEPCIEAKPGPYSPKDVNDAIRVGEQVIVLSGRRIHVLDGIAPAIWDAARSGADLDDIVRHTVRLHGEPENQEPDSAIETAIIAMRHEGLIPFRQGSDSKCSNQTL